MLRDDILTWVLIFWLMLTCIIVLDIYVRIEARAAKKFEQIEKTDATTIIKEERVEEDVITIEQPNLVIETIPTKTYYDVPLSEDLQDYIFALCEERGVDPAIVIAMIGKESVYNPDAVGDGGNSLGLMQIQPRWHKERMKRLETSNLFNPYDNVEVGIDLIAELMAKGKSIEWVLMAYNGGASYANEKLALGIVSDYANTVLTNAKTLNTYEVVVGEVE